MAKRSLGRGLQSLISPGDRSINRDRLDQRKPALGKTSSVSNAMILVPLSRITSNPLQPRSNISQDSLSDLISSIKERGILLPLIVTEKKPGEYQLVAGERRFRAAKALNFPTVPVIVKKVSDQDMLEVALIENIQRQNLNPIDEAKAYAKLKSTFGLSQDEIAKRVGKKRSSIANSLRFLTLPRTIKDALTTGVITPGHAKILLSLPSEKEQHTLFRRLTKSGWSVGETHTHIVVTKRTREKTLPDAELAALQNDLQTALATKVKIIKRGKRGRIYIDYYSLEELKNIISHILKDG